MAIGKLYRLSDNQLVTNVNYQLHEESITSWWGELTLDDHVRIGDGDEYMIELEHERKGKCRLKKRVNRAVTGIPSRYIYRFTGTGKFE